MITVNVRTNAARKSKMVEITDTPRTVFESLAIDVSTSAINLDGVMLRGADMNTSFGELGVTDGTSVNLNALVKADGAAE